MIRYVQRAKSHPESTWRGRSGVMLSMALSGVMAVAACGSPGGEGPAAVSSGPVSTTLGTGPIKLKMYAETGFPLAKALAGEFTKQHPNVTFDIREDQFATLVENAPRVMTSADAPDIIRLPTMSDLVKNSLLKNLDPYLTAYGWDKFPNSQLVQLRIAEGGRPRGTGSLFAMGLGYSITGVFYNKKLAQKVGMTQPPGTVAEFEDLLAKAKTAGLLPVVQFNKNTAGINFPLQALQNQFGDSAQVMDWIFQKPGATYDTAAALKAAKRIEQWANAGYFPKDANALDYTAMMGRFTKGTGLFMFNGDWESANLAKSMKNDVGFFLFPPETAGGKHVAMSAPNSFGISAQAKNPDTAAFFLNWIHTNPKARELAVNVGGSNPGGPTTLPLPEVPAGSLLAETLNAGTTVGKENGAVDFTANATGSIFASAITPGIQQLIVGKQTPEAYVKSVQKQYEKELAQ